MLLARAGDLERELRATSEELCRARRALAVTERKLDQVRETHDAERQKTARLRDEVRRVRELLRFERSRYRPPQRFTDSFDSDDEWAGARVCPPDDR